MHPISGIITAGALLLALALPAAAQAATDRNHDRIPDRWERAHHLTLRVNQAKRDQDHDGLVNRSEYLDHTNPRRKDSDRDGVLDGREDADHDGVTNLAEQQQQNRRSGAKPVSPALAQPVVGTAPVGAVAAFFDGELVVRQADSTELVGTVDDATRLICVPPIQHPTVALCPEERLVPGTRVLVARRTGSHWDLVVLSAVAFADDNEEDEDEDDTDDETAPPPGQTSTTTGSTIGRRLSLL
jgi:hypothetical protein